MRPTWGPPGADRSQVGPVLAPWTLLSGVITNVFGSLLMIRNITAMKRNCRQVDTKFDITWILTISVATRDEHVVSMTMFQYETTMLLYWLSSCFHAAWICIPWWRHQMDTYSALLAICAGNSPATGEFPSQRPVTQSFDVSLICALNKRLSKQSWGWWFETPSRSLWRHCNANCRCHYSFVDDSHYISISSHNGLAHKMPFTTGGLTKSIDHT